jgi:predicted O-methyltransferase YrrM
MRDLQEGGSAMDELPSLVMRAQAVARETGFPLTRQEAGPSRPSACLPGVGRFLAVLAAGCTGGLIGELGTGAGIGTAWMASAMPDDCTLVTAEIDERLAAAVSGLLASDARVKARVQVITGDAMDAMSRTGPFDLLFADSGVRDAGGFAALVSLLRIGGHIVMDDVTPVLARQPGSPLPASDLKRQLFLGEPRLAWTEVVLPDLENSLLAGTRRA